ncbi:MAG: magnesium transport protein CorA [Candidatus Poribacteria bacterium]|nr:MAG: magnesium transport protein CorA [Candidatus Poribacteria bacterium]
MGLLRDQWRRLVPGWAFHHRTPPSEPSGTLIAHADAHPTTVQLVAFGPDGAEQLADLQDLDELDRLADRYPILWINVVGLQDVERIRAIGERFGLHQLAMEDTVNTRQRPKIEDYPNHLYFVLRMVFMEGREELQPRSEQLSVFLLKNVVITFQEEPGDPLDPVRRRILEGRGRIRTRPTDYLVYALLDAVIEGYTDVLGFYADLLESTEEKVLHETTHELIYRIHALQSDLAALRRALLPFSVALERFLGEESPYLDASTYVYWRDLEDHVKRTIDMIEYARDVASALMNFALSMVSYRMNEVMKVLTIIATIFIPLSFIAGIYGMNFNPDVSPWNMPELNWY